MAEHKHTAASEAPKSERLGGKHLADDALLPIVQRTASRFLRYVKDQGSLAPLIRFLQTGPGSLVREATPSALNILFAKQGNSSELAHFARDFFVHVANEIAEIAEEGDHGAEPAKVAEAHASAWNAAMGKKYALVAGSVHKLDCPNIEPYRKHAQRPPRKGKDGHEQPQHPQGSGFHEVTMEQVLNPLNPLKGAPCCFEGVQAEFKKASSEEHAAKHAKKGSLSAMDVIGQAKKEDREKLFAAIAAITDPERRMRVMVLLRHLDSKEEMTALMGIIDSFPAMPDEVLSLLENSNASFKFSAFLGGVGERFMRCADGTVEGAKALGHRIGDGLAEFDAGLAPQVRRLERWREEPPKKRSYLGAIFSLL